MKNVSLKMLTNILLFAAVICAGAAQAQTTGKPLREGFQEPLRGWKTLDRQWNSKHPLDVISIEWEYFMVHDRDSEFVGIIAYVLTNPRGKLGNASAVVPSGGNLAVGGMVHGQAAVGEYLNFGLTNTDASGDSKYIYMENPTTGYWGEIEPLPNGAPDGTDALRLTGSTELFSWDLVVYQGWSLLNPLRHGADGPFTVKPDWKVGYLPGEVWTLDAIWPRTEVVGTVTVHKTGEVIDVDGKGYRENSWGRYVLSVDGWDFLVFSDDEPEGTMMVMQTYHKSTDLDFLDVMFHDNGELKAMRLLPHKGEAGWRHDDWQWDNEPWQCVPMDSTVIGEKDGYRIEAHVRIPPNAQKPFLSNAAIGTAVFFIQEQYPWVEGQITRVDTGELVTTFEGQAGGEFALHKSARLWPSPDFLCDLWGHRNFSHPMP